MASKEYNKEWYERNREEHKKRALNRKRERREELRPFVAELKDVPCADCGGRFKPWQMDFDHVRGEKRFDIAHAIQQGYKRATVEAEIKKCDVVCANCHRDRTHSRMGC